MGKKIRKKCGKEGEKDEEMVPASAAGKLKYLTFSAGAVVLSFPLQPICWWLFSDLADLEIF